MKYRILGGFLSLIFFSSNAFANDCAFVEEIDLLVHESPKKALETGKFGVPAPFLSVADGIGPSRPGIGDGDEARCVKQNYRFHMIWAGADAIQCNRQFEVARKAHNYAKKYNKLLKRKLKSNLEYHCTKERLTKEREVRCSKTEDDLCTGLEDWDGAHSELTKFVWGLNSTSVTGYLPEVYGHFWVSIRDDQHRKEIEESACDIFPKYGIEMGVLIHIELANFNRNTKEWDKKEMNDVYCSYRA